MASSANAWKLGLFVVIGSLLFVSGLAWLGARYFQPDVLTITTYFNESIQGLTVGSPVKFRGVPLGVVSVIDIAADRKLVRVDCEVDAVKLTNMGIDAGKSRRQRRILCGPELRVRISNSGITGAKLIQMDFFDPDKFPVPELDFIPPWNYLPSVPSTLQNIEVGLNRVLESIPDLLVDAVASLSRINEILHKVDVEGVVHEVKDILGVVKERLGGEGAGNLIARAVEFVKQAEATVSDVRGITERLAKTDFESLVTRTNRLLDSLSESLDAAEVAATSRSLRTTADVVSSEVTSLSDAFQSELRALRDMLESVQALASLLERDPAALIRGKGEDD